MERKDQRYLTQGYRPALPAPRAALARDRQSVLLLIRRTYSRRRVRRRFSRYSAGNPFPRNTIHADRFDR